ncbi:metallophosphoesterase family protein [Candidatus Halocynthiibacter alkanivorans]|uniref:metallophosphoesterase family protein n=1 Tax=Candidatus Halocynthiibacter alkanivorans TaxID=2267619 RepID=UPI000DF3CFE8|nr:DNA repair exonuclease [Candidatus Halocynthiibacter alkanivorans]
MIRFIHTSDLHLGSRFGNMPEDVRGRLVDARHQILDRLVQAACDHDTAHILVAGDVFDTETPTDPIWRQALSAMGRNPDIQWWLIPGNHDSLAAESLWDRFRHHAPANVHLIDTAEPVEIEKDVCLLPCPMPRRYPGRDLTDWMANHKTDPQVLRIGLAHGAIRDFSEGGVEGDDIIPPDRAEGAGLDYLALGDWHGAIPVGKRTWYSGTPERDSFRHGGRGTCLAVTLDGPSIAPKTETVETGKFYWADEGLSLVPGQAAAEAFEALLPADRSLLRDYIFRVRASGRATLAEQAALQVAAEMAAPEFCHFVLDTSALETEFEDADLDAIDHAGALRVAAEELSKKAQDSERSAEARKISAAALNRLYGYLQEGQK